MSVALRVLFSITIIMYSYYVFKHSWFTVVPTVVIALVNVIIMKGRERILKLPLVKVGLDFVGALIPLASSIIMLIPVLLEFYFSIHLFALLTSLAIALSALNTIIMEKFFAVNIVSYTITYYVTSHILCDNHTIYCCTLPLATQMGIIIGSDLLHYIYIRHHFTNHVLVIGGAGERDAIYISTILIQWLKILHQLAITLIFSVKLI